MRSAIGAAAPALDEWNAKFELVIVTQNRTIGGTRARRAQTGEPLSKAAAED